MRSFDAKIHYRIIQGGSNLILVARRTDQLEKVAEAASAAHKFAGVRQGGQIAIVQLDVTDRAQVSALWSKVPQDLRNVDILGELTHFTSILRTQESVAAVNNAGGAHGIDRVGDIQDRDIDTMFATNVLGLISLTQLLIKGLPVLYITSLHLTITPPPLYDPSAAPLRNHDRLQSSQRGPCYQHWVHRGKGTIRGR